MDARIHGPAREARLQGVGMAESDNRCAEVQANFIAALLPPSEVEVQPTRSCAVAGRGKADLLDAARLIHEEWEATSASSAVHCWVKSTILPPVCGLRCSCRLMLSTLVDLTPWGEMWMKSLLS